MAAPADMTCKTLSGKFQLNKTLSDNLEPLLVLQGLSWLTRKAIGIATVVLTIKTYESNGITHVDITSVASGFTSTQENRTLDWTDRDHSDRIFGQVQGKSRFSNDGELVMEATGSELDKSFLEAKVLKDGSAECKFLDVQHVQSYVKSQDAPWVVEQVWGFEEVDGKRYYTRRVVGWKGSEVQHVRLIYDYKGPGEDAADEDDGLAYGEQ